MHVYHESYLTLFTIMSFIFTSQIKICQQWHCWIEVIEKEIIAQEFGLSVVEKVSVLSLVSGSKVFQVNACKNLLRMSPNKNKIQTKSSAQNKQDVNKPKQKQLKAAI